MGIFWRRENRTSGSILGLDKSLEELKAEELAAEREFGARLNRAIEKTRRAFNDRLDQVFEGRKKIDAELLETLEELLISADIGVKTTLEVLEDVRKRVSRNEISDNTALREAIKQRLVEILNRSSSGIHDEREVAQEIRPYVIMVVGVNGVGKTTTIGKLAQRIKSDGNSVLICAADTFRAAAGDQLEVWARRAEVPLIKQKPGTDPAAVLFDAVQSAKARQIDVLIVDTAGRLHNKSNLMAELEKMSRIAGREISGAPHETLLVLDAVTGQNGLEQARQFLKSTKVTGIVLTKLDGTAKGGIVIAIANELNLPIRYIGVGESAEDLLIFNAENFVAGLFGENNFERPASEAV
jgi:fused signal recognition particle receptor